MVGINIQMHRNDRHKIDTNKCPTLCALANKSLLNHMWLHQRNTRSLGKNVRRGNPKPLTLNPKLQTLNLEPETLNP